MLKPLKGFTIIELMVTIVIIGIITSIIYINYTQESSYQASLTKAKAFATSVPISLAANFVSEWKFDGDTDIGSAATADDLKDTWSENDGTLSSSPIIRGGNDCMSGKCIDFDGTDDFISFDSDDTLNMTDALTISFWVKRLGRVGEDNIIVSKDDANSNRQYVVYFTNNNTIKFTIFGSSANTAIISSTVFSSLNQWIYVTATYKYVSDGTSIMDLYVNGEKDSTQITNAVGPINTSSTPLIIGDDGETTLNKTLRGVIDDVRIYDVALTTAQVKKEYFTKSGNLHQKTNKIYLTRK
ncbi:MAG: LamG domain-containing protein [Candidatus Paceibacterota bacterium]|jgi:prepilin-type N-terminal cleavage/methylation domain-containing protein|nr:LamG domain-containing protein [bacterium]